MGAHSSRLHFIFKPIEKEGGLSEREVTDTLSFQSPAALP
jgi:hypothetical protein